MQWQKIGRSLRLKMYIRHLLCVKSNRSALMRELLNDNLLFVGKLYKDESLVLCAHDLIFFTTDLQTVNYFSTILC